MRAGPGGEVCHVLVGLQVFGPAIWIATVIDGVDAEEDVVSARYLGVGQGKREEDGVPGGDVGDGDFRRHLLQAASMRYRYIGGERAAAEGAQVDGDGFLLPHAVVARDGCGGLDLALVALPIVERDGMEFEAL